MNKQLSFFNWSLKKALDTEPDNFIKARISIIYTILLFSILKAAVVVCTTVASEQWMQMNRALIGFIFYVSIIKILLYRPSQVKVLAHIMLLLGTLLVWTNVFIYVQKINLITIQFLFMIALCSFYTLGTRFGTIYSIINIIPIAWYMISHGNANIELSSNAQEVASPGFEIIVMLNFVSLVVAHYLFYDAYNDSLREKETLNKQLQVSIAEANELAMSKTNFLSTMSHELRTPLNSVVGITELLLADKPEERQKENLKILQFSTLDLLSLINNVLDFNKIDSGKLQLEKTPFQLAELMKNISAVLQIKASDKKLDFVLDIDPQLQQLHITSDPTRLSQIMYNLVSNAIKFTEHGAITIKLECVKKTGEEVEVMFSIVDTGIGIHPDRHHSIFEIFTQAESHITRKYGGSGLGLAIVKQILALFDSSIYMESDVGKGTKFFFTIPFAVAAEVVKAEPAIQTSNADLSHLRILVAEDNDINRLIIRKQMDKLNLQPVIVENGQLAYEACMAHDYDIVFMDLHMPVLDGYGATQMIRESKDANKASVHIVAFTASVTEQEKIMTAGFNDFLYKPVNMGDLTEKLERIAIQNTASAV